MSRDHFQLTDFMSRSIACQFETTRFEIVLTSPHLNQQPTWTWTWTWGWTWTWTWTPSDGPQHQHGSVPAISLLRAQGGRGGAEGAAEAAGTAEAEGAAGAATGAAGAV